MPIRFESEAHKSEYRRIGHLIHELYGREVVRVHNVEPAFVLLFGDLTTIVSITTSSDFDAVVCISFLLNKVYVADDPLDRAETLSFLLQESYNDPYLAFSILVREGVEIVFLKMTYPASTCSESSLQAIMQATLRKAQEYNAMGIGRTIREVRFVSKP